MNKKQENRFNMYLATVDFCKKNTDITTPLPNFIINYTKLKAICDGIYLISVKLATNISGTTTGKNNFKETLIVLAADTARKLMAFAQLSKDQKLLQEISFTESDLRHLSDTILYDTTRLISDRAQTNLDLLTDYLVNAETQTDLQQAIANYKQAIGAPRVEKVKQMMATKQLSELFVSGDEALEDMDAVVEIVRLTRANFYIGYKLARKVIETGKRKMSVKGLVTDVQTGEPVKGAVISFWPDGDATKTYAAGKASLVKKTADKGGFYVSIMPAGTYRVTLQKIGYTEQTLTVYVNDGELTLVDVKLAKV